MTGATLLHRQIHSSWIQNGRVTSQAFKPTPKDENMLSVYDGGQITAQDAWRHFTTVLKFNSMGVLSVTVSECEACALSARLAPEPFPQHAVIDFTGKGTKEIERAAKQLRKAAVSRDWQYQLTTGA